MKQLTSPRLDSRARPNVFPAFYSPGHGYTREEPGRIPMGTCSAVQRPCSQHSELGAGFTVTFPVFDIAGIRARKSAENARLDAERGRYQQD